MTTTEGSNYEPTVWRARPDTRTPFAAHLMNKLEEGLQDHTHTLDGVPGEGVLLQATIDLTPDQILHLHSSPITLIPAPGVGKRLTLRDLYVDFRFVTYPYKTLTDDAQWQIKIGGSDVTPTQSPWDGVVDSRITHATMFTDPLRATTVNQPVTLGASDDVNAGIMDTLLITDPGSGYAMGDTLVDDNSNGNSDLLVTVDTVDGSGGVLTCHITNPGGSSWRPGDSGDDTGFTNVAPHAGSGSGLRVQAATYHPGDGVARMTVVYQVLTLI